MGDEKNPEKDFEKEKKKKIEKEQRECVCFYQKGNTDEKGAKTEKKEEKRKSRIFIYTSDFIGSDLRRRVSFDSVKESSKP